MTAFGEDRELGWVDRLGVWLSTRQIRKWVDWRGKEVADLGCGYQARLARQMVGQAAGITLVDVSLAPELRADPRFRCLQGHLPEVLGAIPDGSLELVLGISVLEHLWNPEETLAHFHRMLRPGGTAVINVPSWRGKRFLEFSAFRLGWSPPAEMDDHKAYFDVEDLWPLLVRAGFRPSQIRCFRHKGGLNTLAIMGREP